MLKDHKIVLKIIDGGKELTFDEQMALQNPISVVMAKLRMCLLNCGYDVTQTEFYIKRTGLSPLGKYEKH